MNNNWGGVTEDNGVGTHEFLDLVKKLGTEPFVVGNVGSGTVQEMSEWWEYINQPGGSPMAKQRAANGHPDAWNVKFWGVGNESWGCGGNMRPRVLRRRVQAISGLSAGVWECPPIPHCHRVPPAAITTGQK